MTRRELLAALAGAIAFDAERALWVPGRRHFSIPNPPPKTVLRIRRPADPRWVRPADEGFRFWQEDCFDYDPQTELWTRTSTRTVYFDANPRGST